ncbi:MAG: hypothetical protein ACE5FD_05930 [Anaerolineae bacterium]
MANPELSKLDRETTGLKLFPLLTLMGWVLIGIPILINLFLISPTGASYWGENAKAVRDAAAVGSSLLGSLTTLAWWPKLLLPLTILGISSFMVGIALEFAAIPDILQKRIDVLKRAVPLMGK